VFVKDSKEIYTHGNLYKSVNWSVLGSTLKENRGIARTISTYPAEPGPPGGSLNLVIEFEFPVNSDVLIEYQGDGNVL
jgi:hypothetical protein